MINIGIRIAQYLVANIICNAILHLVMGLKFTPIWIAVGFIDPLSWIGAVMMVWVYRYFTVSSHRDHG